MRDKDTETQRESEDKSENVSKITSVLYPVDSFYWSYKVNQETFFQPVTQPSDAITEIEKLVTKSFGNLPLAEVFLSVEDAMTQLVDNRSMNINGTMLTLFCVPSEAVEILTDMLTEEKGYHLAENISLSPFQMQFTVILDSTKEKQEFELHTHSFYAKLYNLIAKMDVGAVLKEIKSLYRSVNQNEKTENFIQSLQARETDLDIFSLFNILKNYQFPLQKDQILTQCILNVIALSPSFIKGFSAFTQKSKNSLLNELEKDFSELPTSIMKLILQYHVTEDEADIEERRALLC